MTGPTTYHVAEAGQRVDSVEFELHFQFGLRSVADRSEDRWAVRTRGRRWLAPRRLIGP